MKSQKKIIATTLAFCYMIGAVPCFVSAMLEGSNEDEQKGQAPQSMSNFLIQSSSESQVYGSSTPMSFSNPSSPINSSRQRSNSTPNKQTNTSILFDQSSTDRSFHSSTPQILEEQSSEIIDIDIPDSPIRPHNAQETNSTSDHLDDSVLDEVHISIKDRMKHPFVNYPKTSYTGLTILFLALIYKPVKWGYDYLRKDKTINQQ